MYSPLQLRMMLPSFALQKMSGQGIRTHPPKPLLVWQFSILIFLGPFFKNAYLFLWLDRRGPFIVSEASSLWRWEDSLTFAVMMVLKGWQSHHCLAGGWQRLLGGWFVVTLVFLLCRQRRTGRGRSPEKTHKRPVKYTFGEMSNDCPWNMVRNPVWDDNYWVRTGRPDRGGGRATCQSMWSSGQRVGRATCPPKECLVRPGCPTTCTLRGGPYIGQM